MKNILLCISGLMLCAFAHAQGPGGYRDTTFINNDELNTLRSTYGQHKMYPEGYDKLILATLSYLPELKDYRVTFRLRNHGAPLSSRPSWGSLFRSGKKREYMVFISTDTSSRWAAIQLNHVPVMAQMAIIAHELCHVLVFKEKTSFGLMGIGINHVSTSYMNRFEFRTDSAVIAHGLGDHLLLWSVHARTVFGATDPEQLNVKGEMYNYKERYMNPATIRRYMDEMDHSTEHISGH